MASSVGLPPGSRRGLVGLCWDGRAEPPHLLSLLDLDRSSSDAFMADSARWKSGRGWALDAGFLDSLRQHGLQGEVTVTHDLHAGLAGADVVHTDGSPRSARVPGPEREAFADPRSITLSAKANLGPTHTALLRHVLTRGRGSDVHL